MISPVRGSDPALRALLARATQRIGRHPAGVGYGGGGYTPLLQAVDKAEAWGGQFRAMAEAACLEVIDAPDDRIAFMLRADRLTVCPSAKSAAELAMARQTNGMHLAAAAARALDTTRPRVTLAEQLAAMDQRGIRFTVHADGLQVRAPDGVLTEGDRALIRENKAGIIAYLGGPVEVF